MPGVQTLTVLTVVAASGALKGTEKTAQVKIKSIRNISDKGILGAVHEILNWSSAMLVTSGPHFRERSVV